MGTNGILQVIKQASAESVEAGKPAGLLFGTVLGVSPLQVRVDQKLTLGAAQLACSSLVCDFIVPMTVAHETEQNEGEPAPHAHAYVGCKQFMVHLGLQAGERVVLLRAQGGQKFLILDRVREAAE